MHFYEYLFTSLIIIIMLVAASTMVATFPETSSDVSEREQLKEVAQKIMTQLLVNCGEPPDWGSNINIHSSDITMFGLAAYSYTTREAYTLDPDKVSRLNKFLQNIKPTLYIQPQQVATLLNLGNDYGFKIEFYPSLNVTVNLENSQVKVKVTSNYDALPIVNANIVAKLYYYDASMQTIKNNVLESKATDYTGECILDFQEATDNKVLILIINYHGIKITKVVMSENVMKACLLGDYMFLPEYSISEDSSVVEVYIIEDGEGKSKIKDIAYTVKAKDGGYIPSYIEPSTKAILAVSGNTLICATKEMPKSYATIDEDFSIPFAYSLERTVVIDNSLWIIRLYVWRMSW
ncbi:MAG: hypothetical protein QW222_01380 [Candidatus Bathyarchaeia archaeon]